MPKFCGVISEESVEPPLPPFLFHDLETVTEELTDKTDDLVEDFNRCNSFIIEQEHKLVRNDKHINEMHDKIQNITEETKKIEYDLDEGTNSLYNLEHMLNTMDGQQSLMNLMETKKQPTMARMCMINQLKDIDHTMLSLTPLIEELAEYQAATPPRTPIHLITDILDKHQRTLEVTENRLKALENNINIVHDALRTVFARLINPQKTH